MPVYLQDGLVLLNSGSVATDAACCCCTGACCVGSDCSIHTEPACSALGGTFLGCGTTCEISPCAPECICAVFGPFSDGMGSCFTSFTAHCDDTLSFDGGVDCAARFLFASCQVNSCCDMECDPCDFKFLAVSLWNGIFCDFGYIIDDFGACCCVEGFCGDSTVGPSTNYTRTVSGLIVDHCG